MSPTQVQILYPGDSGKFSSGKQKLECGLKYKMEETDPRQVKLNVDASYHADVGVGAVGVVIRDYEGKFIAASTKFIPHVPSAITTTETLAMKEGLKLAVLLMTHKYRGCIVVLSINKSVEPNEKQKVLTSGFDQGFTVNTSKRVFRVFGNASK
jgi:hypothetical protein